MKYAMPIIHTLSLVFILNGDLLEVLKQYKKQQIENLFDVVNRLRKVHVRFVKGCRILISLFCILMILVINLHKCF